MYLQREKMTQKEPNWLTPENMKIYIEYLKQVDDEVEKSIQKEINKR